jgi:hypothetical protein
MYSKISSMGTLLICILIIWSVLVQSASCGCIHLVAFWYPYRGYFFHCHPEIITFLFTSVKIWGIKSYGFFCFCTRRMILMMNSEKKPANLSTSDTDQTQLSITLTTAIKLNWNYVIWTFDDQPKWVLVTSSKDLAKLKSVSFSHLSIPKDVFHMQLPDYHFLHPLDLMSMMEVNFSSISDISSITSEPCFKIKERGSKWLKVFKYNNFNILKLLALFWSLS